MPVPWSLAESWVMAPVDMGEGRDYTFTMTGGLLVAAGSSGMAIAPGTSSTQYSVLANIDSQRAGTLFHMESSAGDEILTFAPSKTFQSVLLSSPDLDRGSYSIYVGGSSTGTVTDSLYSGGVYTPGTRVETFTISSITTQVGEGGGPPH